MNAPLISPSILSADFAALGEEVRLIDKAGADMIHVDVMDGHFVPNLTIGPGVVKSLRAHSDKPFDVHLMIAPADPYIQAFADAGADYLTVHPEAGPHLHRTLQTIQSAGCKAGVALNPATPLETVLPVMDMIDLILVMSVNPGFGGQAFLPSQLPRIQSLRQMTTEFGREVIIEVDGGVTPEKAHKITQAGANALVAGTAVFKGGPNCYADNISSLKQAGSRVV